MAERLAASGLAAKALVGAAHPVDDDRASLGLRVFAYLLDSLVLFGFTMLFTTASFLNIFLRSDYGRGNPSDGAISTSIAILLFAVPAWLIVNLMLGRSRSQSVGQYVLGLRLEKEAGGRPGLLRLTLHWLALHPLLFHPLFSILWGLLTLTTLGSTRSAELGIASFAIALLCLLGPVLALLFALADPDRRALHDRIAAIKLVRLAG